MTSEGDASNTLLRSIVGALFDPEKHGQVGVAVSGGSDSMALLDLARHWCTKNDVKLLVATVDHGLRVEAREEAEFVGNYCAQHGLSHTILTWDGWDGKGNLQATARDARYNLLVGWAADCALDVIALGHTRDDQAETFLMRLARQSGLDGLAGMTSSIARDGIVFVRPLLSQSRQVLKDYLLQEQIGWISDPSNEDRRYDRIKAREALTQLEALGISAEGLANSAHHLRVAVNSLDHYTRLEAESRVVEDRGDIVLRRDPSLPMEIERRLIVGILRYIGHGEYPPRAKSLAHLENALNTSESHTLAGCLVSKTGNDLRMSRELASVEGIRCRTDQLWDGRWCLDGPHSAELVVAVLGEAGLRACPDRRETDLPRASLLSTPAIWHENRLVAAPLAGMSNGWSARLLQNFRQFLSR